MDNKTLNDIGHVLLQLHFACFLNNKTIFAMSTTSNLCHKIVNSHISYNCGVLLWGRVKPFQTPYTFKKYTPTKFLWNVTRTLKENTTTTHIRGYEDLVGVILASVNLNIPFLPQQTRYVKCIAEIAYIIDGLPKLTHFDLRGYGSKFKCDKQRLVDNLPSTLTHLRLTSNIAVDNLPKSLTYLQLDYISKPMDYLPPRLTRLILGM